MNRLVWLLCFVVVASSSKAVADQPDADEAARYARLSASLSGAVLVGSFTETSPEAGEGTPPKLHSERYELREVRHTDGNNWLFACRIQYGEHDLTLPLVLPVLWAGDTPVITLDELPVPGFGTFSARVLIHEDHYAGFWNGEGHGGHLFGTVSRKADIDAPTAGE